MKKKSNPGHNIRKSLASKESPDIHRFSADRPIQTLGEDLLKRQAFAQSLARAIQGWRGKDSLVIALYGVWGCGKSSVKNMALDALRNFGSSNPEVVEFNPWQWAGQEGLLEAFFREISVALGKADKSKKGKKRAAKWRFYGAVLKTGSSVFSGITSFLPWLLMVIIALGVGGSLTHVTWLRVVLSIILIVCFVCTVLLAWGGKLSDRLASLFKYYAEFQAKSMEEVKGELKSELENLEKSILVVIDDIDRLTKEETRLLIQLIKANADFPNIVYLLIFQRDIVEKNLMSMGLSGKDYLEKIVQVPFDIPQADRLRIEKVLFAGLDRILEEDQKVLQRFDQARWGNIYMGGLRSYFQTLRNIYRYLSTLSFHVNLLKGDIAFEVNPIDLIALEVLRVFEPEVYSGIAQNREVFAKIHPRDGGRDDVGKIVNSIIERASNEKKESLKEIIKQLFPTIEWALGGTHYSADFTEEWFQNLRVCHPDVFIRYFQLAISDKDISQSELDDIISKTKDRNALRASFRSLQERDLIDVALDRLDSYKEKVPIENALSFIPALFDIADNLPRDSSGFFGIGPHSHASRIIYWFLKQNPDPEQRGKILYDAFSMSDGLSLASSLIVTEEQRREKKKDPSDFLVSDSQLDRLKQLFVSKTKEIAHKRPKEMKNNGELIGILYKWLRWGAPDEVKGWVHEFIKSEENLLVLLTRLTHEVKSQGMEDYVYQKKYRISLNNIEDFVPLKVVSERLANIDRGKIRDDERRAIEAFESALHRREQGKSDDFPWDED